MIPRSSHCC